MTRLFRQRAVPKTVDERARFYARTLQPCFHTRDGLDARSRRGAGLSAGRSPR